MDKITKDRWRVTAAALAVFGLGLIAGALIVNLYHARYASPRRGWEPAAFGPRNLVERLSLSDQQASEVETILGEARKQLMEVRKQSEPQVRQIRSQTDERLKQVLTEEQWEQFQQLKNEMRERHRGPRRGRPRSTNE
jgi:Spy/CpxP family protein refolding chaperone